MNLFSKILFLLSKSEKKNFFLLLTLSLFVALFEALGIASILPFVMLLTSPNVVETNFFFKTVYEFSTFFGVNNLEDFIFFFWNKCFFSFNIFYFF